MVLEVPTVTRGPMATSMSRLGKLPLMARILGQRPDATLFAQVVLLVDPGPGLMWDHPSSHSITDLEKWTLCFDSHPCPFKGGVTKEV